MVFVNIYLAKASTLTIMLISALLQTTVSLELFAGSNCTNYNFSNEIKSFSLLLDKYDNISIVILAYPKNSNTLSSCFSLTNFYIKVGGSEINGVKSLFENDYVVFASEIAVSYLSKCINYQTAYSSFSKCAIEFGQKNSTVNLPPVLNQTFLSIQKDQKYSFLHQLEAVEDASIGVAPNMKILPSFVKDAVKFEQCFNSQCNETTDNSLLSHGFLKDFTFNAKVNSSLGFDFSLYRIFLTVESSQQTTKSLIQSSFLDERTSPQSSTVLESKDIIYYQDITKFISVLGDKYTLSLPLFPETFNLILTYNMKKSENDFSQDKLLFYVNGINPFPLYSDFFKASNPNNLILIAVFGSLGFISIGIVTYCILKLILVPTK